MSTLSWRSLARWQPFREARQPVVWERLPRGGVGDELVCARADTGIVVERPHPDADQLRVVRLGREEVASTC
jgi:hypothetical protein